jgi:hypothetical protein
MAVAADSFDDYSGRTAGWFRSMKLVDRRYKDGRKIKHHRGGKVK